MTDTPPDSPPDPTTASGREYLAQEWREEEEARAAALKEAESDDERLYLLSQSVLEDADQDHIKRFLDLMDAMLAVSPAPHSNALRSCLLQLRTNGLALAQKHIDDASTSQIVTPTEPSS